MVSALSAAPREPPPTKRPTSDDETNRAARLVPANCRCCCSSAGQQQKCWLADGHAHEECAWAGSAKEREANWGVEAGAHSETEIGNEPPDCRTNLDSGYAWLILFVMFLLQSSISGATRVYGIVFAKEVSIGYYDREQASWPIATASAVENLAGILTPALASFMSWRKIELLSTGLFISSNLLAYFSDSLTVDIIALGLVQGLALSTSTVLSLAINNDYFERYRTTAYGIQMSGSAFGVLYLSPLVSWLLEAYSSSSFRLVYLALAAVFCVNIFLVLFIKPRAKTITRKRRHHQTAASSSEKEAAAAAASSKAHCETDEDEEGEMARQLEGVKRVLESLDSARRGREVTGADQRTTPLSPPASPLTSRKRSRFESHFERKNSIASISYEARSRRQSILSRPSMRHSPLAGARRPLPSANSIFTLDAGAPSPDAPNSPADHHGQWQQEPGAHTNMIIKSKSGLELATAFSSPSPASEAAQLEQQQQWRQPPPLAGDRQRVSLNQMRSSPLMGAHAHQLCSECQTQARRAGAKLSPSNSVNLSGLANNQNHLRHSHLASTPNMSPELARRLQLEQQQQPPPPLPNEEEVGSFCGGPKLASENNRSRSNMFELDCASLASQHQQQEWPAVACGGAKMPENCHQYQAAASRAGAAPFSQRQQQQQQRRASGAFERALELARLPYLHCTWMMLALYFLIARVFVIILVDFADDHGFSSAQSAYLLNYWALGELLGRVFLGPLIDLQYMSCKSCIALTCSLLAASIMCMVLVQSYAIYGACSTCIAALISLEYMLINVLMVEYVGKEHVTNCYSLAACISSIFLFARPTLIGLFRDSLGSYDGLLTLLACLALLFGLLFFLLEPLLVRKWPKRELEQRKH